jgi:hypothetical protein
MRAQRGDRRVEIGAKQVHQVLVRGTAGGALDDQPHRRRGQRVVADDIGRRRQHGPCPAARRLPRRQPPAQSRRRRWVGGHDSFPRAGADHPDPAEQRPGHDPRPMTQARTRRMVSGESQA